MFAAQVSAGTILLSEPFSTDPYFKRSVVHIVEHNDMVDIGFIINKCLTIKLTDLIEGIPDNDYTLCLGGPVQPSMLHYIHPFEGLPGSIRVKENVYWGGDFGVLKELLISGDIDGSKIKFFLGYSGWSVGQLEQELKAGDWGIADNGSFDTVCNNGNLWYDIIRHDHKLKEWELIPENPEDN